MDRAGTTGPPPTFFDRGIAHWIGDTALVPNPGIVHGIGEVPLIRALQGGIFTGSQPIPTLIHPPEAVIPLKSGGRSVLEIDYNRMKEVFAEALAERGSGSQINIPIEVRTEDGEMLVRRTIRRLSDESSSGKIFIDARAVGKHRRP